MRCIWVLAAAALTIGLPSAAHAGNSLFAGGPRYDGTVTVDNVTGKKCNPAFAAYFKNYTGTAAYRAKVVPKNLGEALSVELPLGGALYAEAVSGYFTQGRTDIRGSMIMDAFRPTVPNGSAQLTFDPPTILETTKSFTFTGKIINYGFADCTATVSGAFNLRGAVQ